MKHLARQRTRISLALVLALTLGVSVACGGSSDATHTTASGQMQATATATVPSSGDQPTTAASDTATSDPPTDTPAPDASATDTTTVETASPPSDASPTIQVSPSSDINAAGSVLPGKRIISFYGHPNSDQMGILGEYSLDELLVKLREQGDAYTAADPGHPVQLAVELIASVAQGDPGDDGTYLDHTGDDIIGRYVDFADQNGLIVILDVQIGWSSLHDEVERLRPWLEHPNVHLAIDPEFSTGPDRVPGTVIGEVDGSRVQAVVQTLSDLVRDKGLPSKVLIVHQFEEDMITNKNLIAPLPGVDIVLDMDGFGGPNAKLQNYALFVQDQLIEYGGIKLFYKQDDPLLTPEDIVALDPPALVVIYQ
jgi:hypothetical protein